MRIKKHFLSVKLLQDIYGTEFALIRIAFLFSNIYDYNQCIYYNEKYALKISKSFKNEREIFF